MDIQDLRKLVNSDEFKKFCEEQSNKQKFQII